MKNLSGLSPGETCIVDKILTTGNMRRRFADIGLIENTTIECVGTSPGGDPKAFLIRGAVIAIRLEDCAQVIVR